MSLMQEFIESEGLQKRAAQEKMASRNASIIASGKIGIVEGGTGNGKTFSYLVPLIDFLHKNPEEQAIVSTSTIALQDQIIKKDIPKVLKFFKKKYGKDFKIGISDIVRLVGSQNYICEDDTVFTSGNKGDKSRRAIVTEQVGGEKNFSVIEKLALNARKTKSPAFFKDIAGFKVPRDVRNEISCKGKGGCRCHEKGSGAKCAYKAVLEEGSTARVAIVNHSYLATNVGLPFGRNTIIVDEAQDLPDVLSRRSSKEFNLFRFHRVLREFVGATSFSVTFPEVASKMSTARSDVKEILERLNKVEIAVKEQFEISKKGTARFKEGVAALGFEGPSDLVAYVLGVDGASLKQLKTRILGRERELSKNLTELKDSIKEVYGKEYVGEEKKAKRPAAFSLSGILYLCSSLQRHIEEFTTIDPDFLGDWKKKKTEKSVTEAAPENKYNGPEQLSWFERGARSISICRAPVNNRLVQGAEALSLFGRNIKGSGAKQKGVILTSATLSTNAKSAEPDFSHFKASLGLNWKIYDGQVTELSVPSEFNWQSQAKLVIPDDIPAPNYSKDEFGSASDETKKYIETVAKSIAETLPSVDGNSLVLCSSRFQVDAVASHIEKLLPPGEFLVLNQEFGSSIERHLNEMRKGVQPKKVLIGMQSLWQGVDLPGESLRGLFIVKIPFSTPTHPLAVERKENWSKVYPGRNYFTDESLKEACTMMRQGIGRLIRSSDESTEYGVVVCYDPRFSVEKGKGKPYMRQVWDSFPPGILANKESVPAALVPDIVKMFFDGKREQIQTMHSASELDEANALAVG